VIDLSQLSPEKRAFLKINPDFLRGLQNEAVRQSLKILVKDECISSKEEQQIRAEAKRLRIRLDRLKRHAKSRHQSEMAKLKRELREYEFKLDPNLRTINRKFVERLKVNACDRLVCPECGEGDKGNRMNGKPWCFKCNVILVPKDKASKWLKLPTVKVSHSNLKDDVDRHISEEGK